MIDTNKLRGIMAERNKTGQDIAKSLGITPMTFYRKMKKGVFDSDEIQSMIQSLSIEDPVSVFFAPDVTPQVTACEAPGIGGD